MVVAYPALHQSSAGEIFINTKVCCILRGVEYAGYSMDRPASDRRLRPRATCSLCKRQESLCACKTQVQRSSRSRTAQAAGQPPVVVSEKSKSLPVGGEATTSLELQPSLGEALPSSTDHPTTAHDAMELTSPGSSRVDADISIHLVGEAAEDAVPPPDPMQPRPESPAGRVECIDLMSPAPGQSGVFSLTTKLEPNLRALSPLKLFGDFPTSSESSDPTSSESSQLATSDTSSSYGPSRMELEATSVLQFQPILSQPSTSQNQAICDTPKRPDLALTSRRLVPYGPKKSKESKKYSRLSQTTSKLSTHIQDLTLPSPSSQPMAKEIANIPRKPSVFKGPFKEKSSLPEMGEGSSGARATTKGSKIRKTSLKKSKSQISSLRGSSKTLGMKSGPTSIAGFQSVVETPAMPEGYPSTPSTSRVGTPTKYAKKGKTPSSQKVHVCPECGKAFGSPGKLSQHMFSHTGERPFSCSQCSKAFSSKFKLVRHNLIHSAVRRFVCGQCGRQFHRKDHLQNHAKIHAAVKLKFRCDREGCNKEYTSANSARKHSATHAAQDGQLDCVLCGREFSSTPEVLHHLKIHAGSRAVKTQADRKFTCEVCDRSFFTRKDVRRHLVVHTGLRDFLCQYCPQRFGRKDHLVRHIKKSHQTSRTKPRKKSKRVESSPSPSTSREFGSSPGPPRTRDASPPTSRDPGSIPGPSTAQDPSPLLPSKVLTLKEEPGEFLLVEVKQEEVHGLQDISTHELTHEIPLYSPLPPYPNPTAYPTPQEDITSVVMSSGFMKGFMKGYHKPIQDLTQSYPKPLKELAQTYPKSPEDLAQPFPKLPEELEQPFPKTSEELSQPFPKIPTELTQPFPKLPEELPEPFQKSAEDLAQSYPKPTEDMSQFLSIVPDIQRLLTAGEDNGQLLMSIMESVEMSASNQGSDIMPSTSQVVSSSELSSDDQETSMQPLMLPSTSGRPTMVDMSQGSLDLATSLGKQILASTNPEPPAASQGSSLDLGLCEPSLAERLLVPPNPDTSSTSRGVMETLLKKEGDKNSGPLPRFHQAFPPQ